MKYNSFSRDKSFRIGYIQSRFSGNIYLLEDEHLKKAGKNLIKITIIHGQPEKTQVIKMVDIIKLHDRLFFLYINGACERVYDFC